jgi:acetyltransferase-like isoleucine patch superfamily enzyme
LMLQLCVLVHYKTKVKTFRGAVNLKHVSFGTVRIGFGGTISVVENRYNVLWIESGTISFNGRAHFGEGVSIRNKGSLEFGANFSANKNLRLTCSKNIVFGKDVLLGWNCCIRDSDGHHILFEGKEKPIAKDVAIGDHVWICAESHILKGAHLGNSSVLGYKSLLTTNIDEGEVLVAGHPAKIVQEGVEWNY